MSAHQLLSMLLDEALEQAKDIDPRGFNLSAHKGFKKSKPDLQGLPGIDFDIKIEGDHIWLRVARIESMQPPALSDEKLKGLVTIDREPTGQSPRIDETALKHRLTAAPEGRTPAELSADESRARATLQRRLLSTHRCGPLGLKVKSLGAGPLVSMVIFLRSSISSTQKRPPSRMSLYGASA